MARETLPPIRVLQVFSDTGASAAIQSNAHVRPFLYDAGLRSTIVQMRSFEENLK